MSTCLLQPLQLFRLSSVDSTERILLRNDQVLTNQVEEGCTLALVCADNSM